MDYEVYSPRWQRHVRGLADRVFGIGFFAKPSETAREPGSHLVVCVEEEELLGFAHGRLLAKQSLRDFLEHRVDLVPVDLDEADAAGTLGVIESVAVAPQRRGEGIGTAVLSRLQDILIGHGADKLIATFKRAPGATRIDGIMGRLDFEYWMQLESYFRTRCEQGQFKCADRTDTCNCQALFYRKKVF